jgi:hypothetical protein
MISRHMTGLRAFNSSGRLLYCTLYFSNSAIKKIQVLLGPVNEEAKAHHRNEISLAAETKEKRSLADHYCVRCSTILLRPQVMVSWKLWGWKLVDHCKVALRL